MAITRIIRGFTSGKDLITEWILNVPIYLTIQFKQWLLPAIVFALRTTFVIFIASILAALTYYQFGSYFIPVNDLVSCPQEGACEIPVSK